MTEHHIYIYGDILNDQSEFASAFGSVSVSQVVQQLNAARTQNATRLVVHIHSRGGDVSEGFAIHDLLTTSGFEVETIIEGLCASIATVIALAGTERKMTSNSEFFIHNPWADPTSMTGFTADDYAKRADEIRMAETKLLDFYVGKTGADREILSNLMSNETTLTPEQAVEMKFITNIVTTVNAKAYINNTNQFHKMKEVSRIKTALDRVMNFLDGKTKTILALDMTLEDGTVVTIETENTEPSVGDVVTINGEPAPDGEHTLSDGTVIIVAGGVIAEIKPIAPEVEIEQAAEMAQLIEDYNSLSKENKELIAQNAELRSNIESLNSQVKEITSRIKNLSSNFVPQGRTGDAERKNNSSMTDVAARVAARRKQIEESRKK